MITEEKNTIKQLILDINIIIIFILDQHCLFRYGQFAIFGLFSIWLTSVYIGLLNLPSCSNLGVCLP